MPKRLADARPRWLPSSPLAVNGSHPLARGLVFLAAPGADRRDLVGGGDGTRLGGAKFYGGVTPLGRAASSSSTTADGLWWQPNATFYSSITAAITILIWADPSALDTDAHLVAIPYDAGTWVSPFGVEFGRRAVTGAGHFGYPASGVTQNTAETTGTGFIAAADPLTCYAVAWSGSTASFYRNGVLYEAPSITAGSVAWNTNNPINIFNRTKATAAEGVTGSCLLVAVWNRALSAGELQRAYAQPFAMLQPAQGHRRRFLAPTVGPTTGPPPGSLGLLGVGA